MEVLKFPVKALINQLKSCIKSLDEVKKYKSLSTKLPILKSSRLGLTTSVGVLQGNLKNCETVFKLRVTKGDVVVEIEEIVVEEAPIRWVDTRTLKERAKAGRENNAIKQEFEKDDCNWEHHQMQNPVDPHYD